MPSTPPKRPSWSRVRPDPSIPDGWPEGIRYWLERQAREESPAEKAHRSRFDPWSAAPPSSKARQIYSDILCDPRLKEVARTLLSLEAQLQPPVPSLHESTKKRLRDLPHQERRKAFEEVRRVREEPQVQPDELVIPFLEMAVALAERAGRLDKLSTEAGRLKSLAHAAQELLKALTLERTSVCMYLARAKPATGTPASTPATATGS